MRIQIPTFTEEKTLEAQGYRVLSADSGPEAIDISNQHGEPIHLLLTDLVMPHMSGKELAEQLRPQRPDIRMLYMSGHSDSAIAHHGALDEGVVFLPKPFTVENLMRTVRDVLDGRT